MNYQLVTEIEADDCGFHAAVIDVSDDTVLYVSNSCNRPEDAEKAAQDWIDKNQ
ncbi:MAG: hypothetical protein ACYC3I_18155 [Gemmataceae bacterium]